MKIVSRKKFLLLFMLLFVAFFKRRKRVNTYGTCKLIGRLSFFLSIQDLRSVNTKELRVYFSTQSIMIFQAIFKGKAFYELPFDGLSLKKLRFLWTPPVFFVYWGAGYNTEIRCGYNTKFSKNFVQE